jgi:hypothetical protein
MAPPFYTGDVAILFPDCDELMDVCDETLLSNATQSFPGGLPRTPDGPDKI